MEGVEEQYAFSGEGLKPIRDETLNKRGLVLALVQPPRALLGGGSARSGNQMIFSA